MIRKRYLITGLILAFTVAGALSALRPHYDISGAGIGAITFGIVFLSLLWSILAAQSHRIPDYTTPMLGAVEGMVGPIYRYARQLVVLILGVSLLLLGFAMIFLPGPAFIMIPLGLIILSAEFAWAKNLLEKIKEQFPVLNGGKKKVEKTVGQLA
jgi:tellurite resistance protein TerC